MSKAILDALEALEKEKGIKKEIIVEALELALVSAYKRRYGQAQNVKIVFHESRGDIKVYSVKKVVNDVFDSQLEISLEEACKLNPHYEIGDEIKFEVTPKDFGRIAAQTAKQVIMQRISEESRLNIYNEYIRYENEIVSGTVERKDNRYIYVNLGKVEAILSQQDQIPNENYDSNDRIKVLVYRVNNSTKGPSVFVSRSHPDFIKRLFEKEVPEIYDGVVEIHSVAREAGDRAKIAVSSNDDNVEPIGTTVGQRGSRVQAVVDELHGENIDVVEWDKNSAIYIANALKPSEVLDVIFDLENPQAATAIVPDKQLSLAIGKRGQNVRLAARLTGYRIDIRPESEEDAFWETYDEKKAEIEKRLEEHPEELEKFANVVVAEEEEINAEIKYEEKEESSEIDQREEELVEVIVDEERRVDEADEAATHDVADKETSLEVAYTLYKETIAEDEEE